MANKWLYRKSLETKLNSEEDRRIWVIKIFNVDHLGDWKRLHKFLREYKNDIQAAIIGGKQPIAHMRCKTDKMVRYSAVVIFKKCNNLLSSISSKGVETKPFKLYGNCTSITRALDGYCNFIRAFGLPSYAFGSMNPEDLNLGSPSPSPEPESPPQHQPSWDGYQSDEEEVDEECSPPKKKVRKMQGDFTVTYHDGGHERFVMTGNKVVGNKLATIPEEIGPRQFKTRVLYIHGPKDSAKSTSVKRALEGIDASIGWSSLTKTGAMSTFYDGYTDQEILVLDGLTIGAPGEDVDAIIQLKAMMGSGLCYVKKYFSVGLYPFNAKYIIITSSYGTSYWGENFKKKLEYDSDPVSVRSKEDTSKHLPNFIIKWIGYWEDWSENDIKKIQSCIPPYNDMKRNAPTYIEYTQSVIQEDEAD